MELCNVYKVQFHKREPILVAALSFSECISLIYHDPSLSPGEGDEITSISLYPLNIFV